MLIFYFFSLYFLFSIFFVYLKINVYIFRYSSLKIIALKLTILDITFAFFFPKTYIILLLF